MKPAIAILLLVAPGCPRALDTRDTDLEEPAAAVCGTDAEDFAARVEPFLTDAHPASCNACHLSGVDLTAFVQRDACASLACAAELGLVDLHRPDESAILEQVASGTPASGAMDPHDVTKELEVLGAWLRDQRGCPTTCAPVADPCAAGSATEVPAGVQTELGRCTEAEVLARFEQDVWPWTTECIDCHWRGGEKVTDYDAPRWREVDGSDAALRTMYNLLGRDAVNVEQPTWSWLLAKPLKDGSVVETSIGPVDGVAHGGGDRFAPGDPAIAGFASFIGFYLECETPP